mmetsp:Transcript_16782/g.49368  ORF Transcript_16782/g.49368 Transcript_16782/m.49368 type:complete len:916 (+) Transcript_16782:78-2825(+)
MKDSTFGLAAVTALLLLVASPKGGVGQSNVPMAAPSQTPTVTPSVSRGTGTGMGPSAPPPSRGALPSLEPTASPAPFVTTEPRTSDDSTTQPLWQTLPVMVGAALAVFVLVVVATMLVQRRRRFKRLRRLDEESALQLATDAREHRPVSFHDHDEEDGMLPPWEVAPIAPESLTPFKIPSHDVPNLKEEIRQMKIVDIDYDKVQLLQAIDTGDRAYSIRRAVYTSDANSGQEASVKTIDGPGTGMVNDNLRELLREAAAMAQFVHPNVVTLIGIVWKPSLPGHPLVLYEHMSHGPLDKFLRKAKPRLQERLAMCAEVTAGVAYLASVKFVIGHLSAKVVMVDKNEHCKIGDFFMGRDIHDAAAPLPRAALSWYAPELYRQCDTVVNPLWRKSGDSGLAGQSLASTDEDPRQTSTQADVWALGMVLWETLCNAEMAPYHKYPTSRIVGLVRHGDRPAPPSGCPRDVYSILIDCWHPNPVERPLAADVLDALPRAMDHETSLGSDGTTYPDLQKKYIIMLDSNDAAAGGAAPDVLEGGGRRQRAPSPLIHMSLVGLKTGVNEVAEQVAGFSTLSSRPSNYTSESGSNPSLHDRTPQVSPGHTDDGRPAFTELFNLPDDNGPLPPTLLRSTPQRSHEAVDGYLQISPESSLYDSAPRRRLTRSASERTTASNRNSASGGRTPERRKSAFALAMEGIKSLDTASKETSQHLSIPAWVDASHRRSASRARSLRHNSPSLVYASACGTLSASSSLVKSEMTNSTAESPGDDSPGTLATPPRPKETNRSDSPRSDGLRVSGIATATADAGSSPEGEHPKDSAGRSGSGWFRRRQRSSSSLQQPVTFHSSPEPGVLPDDPPTKPKARRPSRRPSRSSERDDERGSPSPRESPSPPMRPYTGGLTLTTSALHRIGRQLSEKGDK